MAKQNNCVSKIALLIANFAVSSCVITPLVVCLWYSTWNIIDKSILPQDPANGTVPHDVLVKITSITISATTICTWLLNLASVAFNTVTIKAGQTCHDHWVLVKRLYLILACMACTSQWWSIWSLLDMVFAHMEWVTVQNKKTTPSLLPTLLFTIACLFVVMVLKVLRNILWAPLMLLTDDDPHALVCETRFQTQKKLTLKHALDHLFSSAVVLNTVSCVWWGVWKLLDMMLFPDKPTIDTILASIIIGYITCVLVCIFQYVYEPISKSLHNRRHLAVKVLLEDVFVLVAFFGCINVWRGLWLMFDYFLSEVTILGVELRWVCFVVAMLVLLICQVFASSTIRGCQVDGEIESGEGVLLAINVFGNFCTRNSGNELTEKDGLRHDTTKITGSRHWSIDPTVDYEQCRRETNEC